MDAVHTDIAGIPAAVGAAAPIVRWSVDAVVSSKPRHQLATGSLMSAYEVHTINGFQRRPSGGST